MSDQETEGRASFSLEPQGISRKAQAAVTVFAVALVASLIYAFAEHRTVQQLTLARDQVAASLNQTKAQVDVLTARLNAMASAPPPAAALAPDNTPAPEEHPAAPAHHRAARRVKAAQPPPDDPRWKQVQSALADHQKLIADNQKLLQDTQRNLDSARTDLENNLKSTHDELSGSIAKTHEELVALQKKGERNYYEFDLDKSKQFQHIGPISVSLRKLNFKHDFCDLEMLIDDNRLSKKHVNLYEPVMFYPEGYSQPLELVVNRIDPGRIHGYLSEPKYQSSRAVQNAPATPPPGSTTPANAELNLQQQHP